MGTTTVRATYLQGRARTTVVVAAVVALGMAAGMPAQGPGADPRELIRYLTHQTEGRISPAYLGCGETTRDRLVARSLAQMGPASIGPLEEALNSIEQEGEKSRYAWGAGWLLIVYAKIGGPEAEARLRRMAAKRKLAFLGLDNDDAIALAQSITSHVTGSRKLSVIFDCTRSLEPRRALDQLILAWERGDRQWLEASLSPRAKEVLRALLARKSWAALRRDLWRARAGRDVAIGYRFNGAGLWGEPWETLEAEYEPVRFDLAAPRIDTQFKTARGGDCGLVRVEFVKPPSPLPLAYLIDNADLSSLLRTITDCAFDNRGAAR